jgi:hypothetical protein
MPSTLDILSSRKVRWPPSKTIKSSSHKKCRRLQPERSSLPSGLKRVLVKNKTIDRIPRLNRDLRRSDTQDTFGTASLSGYVKAFGRRSQCKPNRRDGVSFAVGTAVASRPPAQIRTCPIRAYDSYLEYLTASCPYASEHLGHTSPALCPVCALLACVPFGPRPWLRRRLPGLVRRLHGYYGGVGLPTVVHYRLRLLALPDADQSSMRYGRPWDLPVPVQEASAHASVCDHSGSSRRSLMARPCVWPSTFGTVSAPRVIGLSRFNGWPVHSPADASPAPLRAYPHGSGADVDRYSFIARDLHPQLLAGLPAHSENLHRRGSEMTDA